MNPGNLQAASGRLQEALEKLQLAWSTAREEWRDENSRHLEEEILEPLAAEVAAAIPTIGHLTQTLAQARRECEE
jgi:hypothetical protein